MKGASEGVGAAEPDPGLGGSSGASGHRHTADIQGTVASFHIN